MRFAARPGRRAEIVVRLPLVVLGFGGSRSLETGAERRFWSFRGATRPSGTLGFGSIGSAKRTSSGGRADRRRARAGFFLAPTGVAQRHYEALRAYFVEDATAVQVAERFGYAPSTVVAMVRDFTADADVFFSERRPGPRLAPSKTAARDEVLRLRATGRSVTEITQALSVTATPLNRTGVWEVLVAEGHERLAPRAPSERGALTRDHPPRVRVMRWPKDPLRVDSAYAGALLLLPGLVALDLPGAVADARFPAPGRSRRSAPSSRCWP